MIFSLEFSIPKNEVAEAGVVLPSPKWESRDFKVLGLVYTRMIMTNPPAVAGGSQSRDSQYVDIVTVLCQHRSVSSPHMWNDTDTPLAYLISFRTYGTWLHGDERGSIDRLNNRYGSPYLPGNTTWHTFNQQTLKTKPVVLSARQRKSIEVAISETCTLRKWWLHALNVRTNHVHAVVTADVLPERVLNALKANATRQLRGDGLWLHWFSPWADKGSNRWLWNELSVDRAIDYVLYGQGDELPGFD